MKPFLEMNKIQPMGVGKRRSKWRFVTCFSIIRNMPTKLKVVVVRARDLPIMDSASQLTDAYVEVSPGSSRTQLTPPGETVRYIHAKDAHTAQNP